MENNKIIKYERGLVQHVGNAVNITNKLLSVNLRLLKILYLDDHPIYVKGISNIILKKFPNSIIKNIQDGDKALEYVTNCLENNALLDLIITDISHPGLNGIDFSNAVRAMEIDYDHTIPILFITMHDDKSEVQKIEKIPLAKYLSKCSWEEEINLAIHNLT